MIKNVKCDSMELYQFGTKGWQINFYSSEATIKRRLRWEWRFLRLGWFQSFFFLRQQRKSETIFRFHLIFRSCLATTNDIMTTASLSDWISSFTPGQRRWNRTCWLGRAGGKNIINWLISKDLKWDQNKADGELSPFHPWGCSINLQLKYIPRLKLAWSISVQRIWFR